MSVAEAGEPKDHVRVSYYKKKGPIFRGQYRFLQPPICGQTEIPGKESGYIRFPVLTHPGLSLHKECGQSVNKKIKVSPPDLKLGLIQMHLKMKDLASGAFTLTWKYE